MGAAETRHAKRSCFVDIIWSLHNYHWVHWFIGFGNQLRSGTWHHADFATMGLSPPRHCKCIGLIHLRQLNIERLGEQLWGSTCCYMGEHLLLTIERLPLYKFRCKVTKKQKNKQACVVSRYKFGSSSHVGLLSKGYSFSEYQSNCGLYTTPSADLIARRPSLVVRCLLPHCRWKVNMAYNKNKRCYSQMPWCCAVLLYRALAAVKLHRSTKKQTNTFAYFGFTILLFCQNAFRFMSL